VLLQPQRTQLWSQSECGEDLGVQGPPQGGSQSIRQHPQYRWLFQLMRRIPTDPELQHRLADVLYRRLRPSAAKANGAEAGLLTVQMPKRENFLFRPEHTICHSIQRPFRPLRELALTMPVLTMATREICPSASPSFIFAISGTLPFCF
jgi:hypothetical protein